MTKQLTQDQMNHALARVPNVNEATLLYYLDCEAKVVYYKRLQALIEAGNMEAHLYAGTDTILYPIGPSLPLYSPL